MADGLKKFGKYFLLDLLAQGGMAEIYRAKDQGDRLVAIKRIIPSYSSNPEFVAMFRSEIKTASGFTHPNIIQVYDYGEEQSMLYIAMELVDGKNLRQFISRSNELKAKLPIEVCVYIIEQAAQALNYAHNFKDKITGKSLDIVHRDISPQNILISYDGAVKVIDFGIAKAVTNMEHTKSGVIKGKPSYLSPEQIIGDPLDGRSDVFALGVVMWELLTGKKLFSGENDFSVIKQIENCNTNIKPPSVYNSAIPKELDSIVMKSLRRNRDERYLSAEELQRALHKFLYQYSAEFNPADLSYYIRDSFKNEIVQDRQKLQEINGRLEKLMAEKAADLADSKKTSSILLSQPPPPPSTTTNIRSEDSSEEGLSNNNPGAAKRGTGSFREVQFSNKYDQSKQVKLDLHDSTPSAGTIAKTAHSDQTRYTQYRTSSSAEGKNRTSRSKKSSSFALVIILSVAAAAAYVFYIDPSVNPLEKFKSKGVSHNDSKIELDRTLRVEANVTTATVTLDGKEISYSLPFDTKVLDGKEHLLEVFSNGYKKFSQSVSIPEGEKKTIEVVLERENSTDGSTGRELSSLEGQADNLVLVKFNVQPSGGFVRIVVDGKEIDPLLKSTKIAFDTPTLVQVERDGFKTFRKSLQIDSSQVSSNKEWTETVVLEQAQFGFLSVKTTPSAEAVFLVDGVEERVQTPFSRKRLPIGSYSLHLQNQLLGMEKDVQVQVTLDGITNIEERLELKGSKSQRLPSSK